MRTQLFILFIMVSFSISAQGTLTLEECYIIVEKNYPISKQSNLLEEKSKTEVSVLNKGKLPQVNLNAQATYQSDVIQLPIQLPNISLDTPNKDQYRATLDVNQLIYNGGSISAKTNLKKAELKTQQQQVVVNLHSLKARVNKNFFNVLLIQEQIKQLNSKKEQLNERLTEVKSGVKHGAILPSTEQMLMAEILKLEQQILETDYNRVKALNHLASLLSINLPNQTALSRPQILIAEDTQSRRPELKLFDFQENQLQTTKEIISKSNYPLLVGFAQVGYGNPGLNMLDNSFQDFYITGLRLSWNILDWGKVNKQQKAVEISKEILLTEKETFVLNNNIQLNEAKTDIEKFEKTLLKDIEIINLREQVLQAATSQFQNGVITSSEYIIELNNLYEAKISKELHQTQLSLAKANYKVIKGE
ncbi:MAG TPA: TolC family protein [Aequorivita sp.]|nr:TolC family protein [Aequorivita sp.]